LTRSSSTHLHLMRVVPSLRAWFYSTKASMVWDARVERMKTLIPGIGFGR
jgi:hypothetical protein